MFNDIEKIIYALTLADRPGKREGWLASGFNKINSRPGALLNYWVKRMDKKEPSDVALYYSVLQKYQITHGLGGAKPASAKEMIRSSMDAAARWVKSGLQNATKEVVTKRENICKQCESWDAGALSGTGRCKLCGCSTWAKIRMPSEACPIGRWEAC